MNILPFLLLGLSLNSALATQNENENENEKKPGHKPEIFRLVEHALRGGNPETLNKRIGKLDVNAYYQGQTILKRITETMDYYTDHHSVPEDLLAMRNLLLSHKAKEMYPS